mmetsp:Transcript_26900/g.25762  ORF Transcript_26900/g.25762 Transcript_26900/m.25762 type:complete len:466 (+) Transcript_26900:210-1607(+)
MTYLKVVEVDKSIVILSLALSFFGCYCAINICEQFRLCLREKSKILPRCFIMILMAVSIGGVAIFSMHFIGMAAVKMEDPNGNRVDIRYRIDLTIVSLVVVIFLSYCGIYICSKDHAFTMDRIDTLDQFVRATSVMSISELKLMKSSSYVLMTALFQSLHRLIIGGIITALGACACHFFGMSAVVSDGMIEWQAGLVAAAVIIALISSIVAYWILFRLLALFPRLEVLRLTSSFLAAIAFSGMHYVGVTSARFVYIEGKHRSLIAKYPTVRQDVAMLWAIVLSVLFLLGCFILITADLRAWYYNNSDTLRSTDNLMFTLENDRRERMAIETMAKKYKDIRPSYEYYSPPLAIVSSTIKSNQRSSSPATSARSVRNIIVPPPPIDGSSNKSVRVAPYPNSKTLARVPEKVSSEAKSGSSRSNNSKGSVSIRGGSVSVRTPAGVLFLGEQRSAQKEQGLSSERAPNV